MILLGYKKGLVKVAVKLCAFLIAVIVTLTFYKPVSNLIIDNMYESYGGWSPIVSVDTGNHMNVFLGENSICDAASGADIRARAARPCSRRKHTPKCRAALCLISSMR